MVLSSLPLGPSSGVQGSGQFTGPAVIACIDDSQRARGVALAAASYAQSFDRPLVLFHVLEQPGDVSSRPDPFEWNLRRHEARRELGRLRDSLPDLPSTTQVELNEGDWLTALADRGDEAGSLVVVGTSGPRKPRASAFRAARLLAEAHPGAVLLVPHGYAPRAIGRARIAVPIDGSNHAEAALAEASRLARRLNGELLLVHVVPDAGLAEFGPPAASDLELQLQVNRRNEQVACGFLEKTRRRLVDQGLAVRSLCLKGDTRSALLRILTQEMPDLVVLSARGQGGRRCNDLSIGSTASYLLDHLESPVMLVKAAQAPAGRRMSFAPEERISGSAHTA